MVNKQINDKSTFLPPGNEQKFCLFPFKSFQFLSLAFKCFLKDCCLFSQLLFADLSALKSLPFMQSFSVFAKAFPSTLFCCVARNSIFL